MDTKQKILLAALEEFAEKGYQATTTRDICRKVNMNTAAANYHFNTKQELYKQTFQYLFEKKNDIKPTEKKHITTFSDCEKYIKKWILDFLLSTIDALPFQRRSTILIAREMTTPSEIFPWLYDNYFKPIILELQECVEYLFPKKNKEDILFEVFSLLSQCLFYVQNRSIAIYTLGEQIYTKEKLPLLAEHIYQSIDAKIKNPQN